MAFLFLTEGYGAPSLSQRPYLSQLDYEVIKAVHEGADREAFCNRLGLYPSEIDGLYEAAMERL